MPYMIKSQDPQDIISLFFGRPQHDAHMREWRWHQQMKNINPNYLEAIRLRQEAKRRRGE